MCDCTVCEFMAWPDLHSYEKHYQSIRIFFLTTIKRKITNFFIFTIALCFYKGLSPLTFIADPGSHILLFYCVSRILFFIANPGYRIFLFFHGFGIPGPFYFSRIFDPLILSQIWDPGSSYFIADLSKIRNRIRIQSLIFTN
jgi:hypothetical protein